MAGCIHRVMRGYITLGSNPVPSGEIMNLYSEILEAISHRPNRPKGIRLSVTTFQDLEIAGHITRASGGPLGLVWFANIPWFDKDIYAWCDPSFDGIFELPAA